MKRLNWIFAILLAATLVIFINSTPWHRQPTVFYEPLILPITVLEGDIIVLEDGSHIQIESDRRINSILHGQDSVTINATVYRSLLQILFK